MVLVEVVSALLAATSIFFGVALARSRKALAASNGRALAAEGRATSAEYASREMSARFSNILDPENAAAKARAAVALEEARLEEVRSKYTVGLRRMSELETAVKSLEEDLENIDIGIYRPHFTFTDTEAYKRSIEEVRDRQKLMIKAAGATSCGTTWTVGGSAKEGARMVKQTEKLILRAFNAEAEAAVSNVSWNNYQVMEARISKAFEVLNKHGTVLQVKLTEPYLRLRVEELRLVFEAEHKLREEREEQRRQRAEQKEEERAQRELQREQDEAEEEETRHAKALAIARNELSDAIETERESLLLRVKGLEADLAAAHERKERAVAQAQLTKVGHVYVISNVGAFGEGVVKIGLTRRLDPELRVRELGDASVPFPFDIHALVYSENAPELEARLHNAFWDKRVNWANDRKEFFKVELSSIQAAFKDLGLATEILIVPEAREYRETLAAHTTRSVPIGGAEKPRLQRFPDDPFASEPVSTVETGVGHALQPK